MRKLRYTFKTDILFKMLFVKHPELLKHLIAALLGIRVEEIREFAIHNPEIPPEILGSKFCRLDIKMIVNAQIADLEVQIRKEPDYGDRMIFYGSTNVAAALPAGERYSMLPRTVVISIIDFNQFDCEEFHSYFETLEVTRHTPLSDKIGYHFYELRKLPEHDSENENLLLWLKLFRAETEEDLEKIESMGVPIMEEAISAYRTITATPEFRELVRLREKAAHDEASALGYAKLEGKQEGLREGMQKGMQEGLRKGMQKGIQKGASERSVEIARTGVQMGMAIEDIIRLTGLAREEVEKLS